MSRKTQELFGDQFTIVGTHSIERIEFDQQEQFEGVVTIYRTDGSDWTARVNVQSWGELVQLVKSRSASEDDVQSFLDEAELA